MPIKSFASAADQGNGPLVGASILSADFANMGDECQAALMAGADLLHLDVMDGHFVSNLTMGPAMCHCLRRAFPAVCLDVHLMVTEPALFVDPFAKAGASNLTFHIEAVPKPSKLAKTVHDTGMTAGLAINPPTDVEAILPYVRQFNVILIMSVNPGFSGQALIPQVLEKARAVKRLLRPDQRLEIDGGVRSGTAPACIAAGCDVLVAASAIFDARDYAKAVAQLRGRAAASKRTGRAEGASTDPYRRAPRSDARARKL
jgi:ribulose-phosphate 3-epimerase